MKDERTIETVTLKGRVDKLEDMMGKFEDKLDALIFVVTQFIERQEQFNAKMERVIILNNLKTE
ncbi:MAG: hypothetical protein LBQ45_02270 [Mycoplasmataceae bacterium]|nr:hypothetical protein [Mycoplasmataceae bacterium]